MEEEEGGEDEHEEKTIIQLISETTFKYKILIFPTINRLKENIRS